MRSRQELAEHAMVFVALLRAVNVGGTGKLDMKALRASCEAVGFGRVSTYIQSGNILFESSKRAEGVKATIEALLRDDLGLKSVCVVRTAPQLASVIEANPFADAAVERPHRLLVSFLEGKPSRGARAALAVHAGPERLHLSGEALYVDYAEGAGRSKLSPAFIDRALGTPSTARNWNTVNRLHEMAATLADERPTSTA